MKNINYSFLRAICALLISLVLILFPAEAGNYLVITIGIVFMVPSIFSIVGYFTLPIGFKLRFPVEAVGGLLFGLWLMIMPSFFADLLTYLLGFILLMGGVQQIAALMGARHWVHVPVKFYIIPVLILLAGFFALFNPTGVRDTAFTIIGITGLVYTISELVNWFAFTRKKPKVSTAPAIKSDIETKQEDGVDDAEILE
ncbi:DUF308 domain-containing protein [Bacteroidaceae bacterium HV4-6-C5C]|nr:DUF308 domain-containing protein [Bacteroidaceae bacterium HV4-6-C5C]